MTVARKGSTYIVRTGMYLFSNCFLGKESRISEWKPEGWQWRVESENKLSGWQIERSKKCYHMPNSASVVTVPF